MKDYTFRIAHLKEASPLSVGDEVTRGDLLGTMGSTGSSTANHVHADLIRGIINHEYHLKDIEFDRELLQQLVYFIDREFFDTDILITTHFGDPGYIIKGKWKMHPAFDVVPLDRKTDPGKHSDIYWNRSKNGIVLANGFDPAYGFYLHVGFSV